MKTKRIYFLVLILVPFCALLTQCFNSTKPDPRDEVYAGSAKCIKCHSDIYNSYLQTAHFESSRPSSVNDMHGAFTAHNSLFKINDKLKIVMEKRDSGLYQVAYQDGKEVEAHRFDITFGGVKAETYLYWKNKQLFELPLSYFSALHNWTNSPGYAAGAINFDRPIVRRCFECHSSYIKELPQDNIDLQKRKVEFDAGSIIYGIDCERCHGPAANHVNYHEAYPNEKKARYITTFATLTRGQKLDACAVCHSSSKQQFTMSAFKFKPGDTLAKFREPDFIHQTVDPNKLDVHGNQNGLLSTSKCFLMSNMDCTSCHDTHKKERGNLALFSQKCMQCHNTVNHNVCKVVPQLSAMMKNNCIDCHMPLKPSSIIDVEADGGKSTSPYLVRTHRIAIYPEESKKIMAFLNAAH